jgi:stress-induced-phosphoprotein 1
MFKDPNLIQKLGSNPKTSNLLADSDFMLKLQRIRQNPQLFSQELGDPRFLSVLSVLMGVDLSFGDPSKMGPQGGEASGSGSKFEEDEDVPMPDAQSGGQSNRAPEPEPESEVEDAEAKAMKEAKVKADEEKKLGTESYKKRQFDAAIEHYSKAWELHKDITYLTNLGAAYFEKGDYQKSIEACQKAVEEGREQRADFKLIAK